MSPIRQGRTRAQVQPGQVQGAQRERGGAERGADRARHCLRRHRPRVCVRQRGGALAAPDPPGVVAHFHDQRLRAPAVLLSAADRWWSGPPRGACSGGSPVHIAVKQNLSKC
jgi:hypothetical protein